MNRHDHLVNLKPSWPAAVPAIDEEAAETWIAVPSTATTTKELIGREGRGL